MKTAEDYLHAEISGPEVPAMVSYAAALAAVRAALAEAPTAAQQFKSVLHEFFPAPKAGVTPIPIHAYLGNRREDEPPF